MIQIKEIVLYGKNKQKRSIDFKIGETNIIVGDSSTGKSALNLILEYCFGSDDCKIFEGPIRDSVSWYGILLQLDKEMVFIARKNPDPGQKTSSKCYYEQNKKIQTPEFEPIQNTDNKIIKDRLTRLLNISPGLKLSRSKTMNLPFTVNFTHASLFCYQSQYEIATNKILFHRQDEEWIEKTLSITAPYFLGAIPENLMALEFDLLKTRRELFRLEAELKEYESIKGEASHMQEL